MTTVGDLNRLVSEGEPFIAPVMIFRWDVSEMFDVRFTDDEWDDFVRAVEQTYIDEPHKAYLNIVTDLLKTIPHAKYPECVTWKSVDDWETEYRPYENWLVDNPSWSNGDNQGVMFETFGVEREFIDQQLEKHLWSYIGEGNGTTLVAGKVILPVPIGYLFTAKPWKDKGERVIVS